MVTGFRAAPVGYDLRGQFFGRAAGLMVAGQGGGRVAHVATEFRYLGSGFLATQFSLDLRSGNHRLGDPRGPLRHAPGTAWHGAPPLRCGKHLIEIPVATSYESGIKFRLGWRRPAEGRATEIAANSDRHEQ